jgi:hypothetical protein
MDSDYLVFIPWVCIVCWQLARLVWEDCFGRRPR